MDGKRLRIFLLILLGLGWAPCCPLAAEDEPEPAVVAAEDVPEPTVVGAEDSREPTVVPVEQSPEPTVVAAAGEDVVAEREAIAASPEDEPADTESAETTTAEDETPVQLANWSEFQPPIGPVSPEPTVAGVPLPTAAIDISQSVFGTDDVRRSLITEYRRGPIPGPGSEFTFGSEALFRVTTDSGNLLHKSLFTPSVKVQQRTPIVTDPYVRGRRYARLVASGSYWAPARQDLDTLLSKIDSGIIRDIVVIKGPYTSRLGPGHSFVDFQLLEAPRYPCGSEVHASTGLEYKTNGEQWYGNQAVWGGGPNYGFRVSYGHRTGNDYDTGSDLFDAGGMLPTSYNSRYLDVAFGYDFSPDSHLEFNYLRLDQTGVEFPGLVFDIRTLYTDGYELRYTLENQLAYDLLTVEGWYNRTKFDGNTAGVGKNRQIPSIRENFGLDDDEFLITDVDGMSAGYRVAVTWGEPGCRTLTVGTDLIRLGTQLNDIVPEHDEPLPIPPYTSNIPEQNFPIPRSHSIDVGIFAEHTRPYDNGLTVRVGTRVDLITTDARNRVPGMGDIVPSFPDPILVELPLTALKEAALEQKFYPWSVYLTADYELNCCWTLTGGAGHAMRPPTLTELYAYGSFIGSLQPGLTFVEGDPLLDPEKLTQIDLGIRGDLGGTRVSLNGFYAWVNDYITYDDIGELYHPTPTFKPTVDFQHVAYVNTDLATLMGFEFFAEYDFSCKLTGFARMSYVEGRDHTRRKPSRIAAITRERNGLDPDTPRSFNGVVGSEWLPGIPPLETRLGLHLHEASPNPYWGVELETRIVDRQERVARTLFEAETPGFVIWNLRGYWRACEDFTLFAGVENFTDRFYREHLDYRPGRSVYRPGVNFYFLSQVVY